MTSSDWKAARSLALEGTILLFTLASRTPGPRAVRELNW